MVPAGTVITAMFWVVLDVVVALSWMVMVPRVPPLICMRCSVPGPTLHEVETVVVADAGWLYSYGPMRLKTPNYVVSYFEAPATDTPTTAPRIATCHESSRRLVVEVYGVAGVWPVAVGTPMVTALKR